MDVLKVKKVFLFRDSSDSQVPYFGETQTIVSTKREDFPDKVVYEIVNGIKKAIYTPDGDFLGYEDFDVYQNSRWSSPEYNIENTDDPNVLILGTISHSADSLTPYFEGYSYNCDTGCEIVSHIHHILEKHLQTDKYKRRICFWLMDFITNMDYASSGHRWISMPKFIYFLSWELHKNTQKFSNWKRTGLKTNMLFKTYSVIAITWKDKNGIKNTRIIEWIGGIVIHLSNH